LCAFPTGHFMQNVPLRLEDTFAYTVTMPPEIRAVWPAQIDVQIRPTPGQQLLGDCPTLHLVDIGIIEGGGPLAPWCRILKPRVAATEFTLTSSEATTDVRRSVSFRVDRAFAAAIHPGDEVHIARTTRRGVGLSVIRGGRLIAAIGAVSAVPLATVQFRVCNDLNWVHLLRLREELIVEGCEGPDPDFPETPLPIEVVAETGQRTGPMFRGGSSLESYSIDVLYTAFNGVDECVSIALDGAIGRVPSRLSMQLLACSDGLSVVG
jgi:hypothetical protein